MNNLMCKCFHTVKHKVDVSINYDDKQSTISMTRWDIMLNMLRHLH